MSAYRLSEDHAIYFVTFSVVDWLPVFVAETACSIITDSLNFCHKKKYLRTNAFVIMPTHVHAVLFDAEYESDRLRKTLANLRKFTGRQLIDYCAHHMPSCYTDTIQRKSGEDRKKRFWQSGIHPEAIFSHKFWKQKVDYIHVNPPRKGLVLEPHQWRYSSAAYWLVEGDSDVILTAIEW